MGSCYQQHLDTDKPHLIGNQGRLCWLNLFESLLRRHAILCRCVTLAPSVFGPDYLRVMYIRNIAEVHLVAQKEKREHTVDVRGLPPPMRHEQILRMFDDLKPGETMLVVNDHEPVHLAEVLKHMRKNFDAGAYRPYQRGPFEWVGEVRRKKEEEKSEEMGVEPGPAVVFTSFDKERKFDDQKFSPIPIYTSETYRVILVYFRAGQLIPVHAPSVDLVLLVYSGRGELIAGSERHPVKPGDVAVIPRGTRRGVKAETDMQILHLVSPPPTDKDHEEMRKKLASGSFE